MRPAVVSLLALAACASASSATPRIARTTLHVADEPQRALLSVKADAMTRGWRVVDEGPDSLVVDFGTAMARVPVATEGGGVSMRDTEVHATALFRFDPGPGGAAVTMWNHPIYWHPDHRVWLPAPDELSPGDALLAGLISEPRRGGPDSAAASPLDGAAK